MYDDIYFLESYIMFSQRSEARQVHCQPLRLMAQGINFPIPHAISSTCLASSIFIMLTRVQQKVCMVSSKVEYVSAKQFQLFLIEAMGRGVPYCLSSILIINQYNQLLPHLIFQNCYKQKSNEKYENRKINLFQYQQQKAGLFQLLATIYDALTISEIFQAVFKVSPKIILIESRLKETTQNPSEVCPASFITILFPLWIIISEIIVYTSLINRLQNTMSQNQRRSILKKDSPNPPQKRLAIKIRENTQEIESASENLAFSTFPKNKQMQHFENPESERNEMHQDHFQAICESPVLRQERAKTQPNIELNTQSRFPRSPSGLNDHWDDSFKSILKSNQAYRRELLSAYEEKVKIQTEKSKIQKELVNLQFQNEELIALNKQLEAKVASMNKSVLKGKQNVRINVQHLQGDVNRLKHEINLQKIEKEEMTKAYEEVINNSKNLEGKLAANMEQKRIIEAKNEELKGEIAFLLGKINEGEEEYFILEQKFNNSRKNIENLQIKLNRASEETSRLAHANNIHEGEINHLKIKNVEEIEQRDAIIDMKMKQLGKSNARLKEVNDQVAHLRQENSNLMGLVKSLKYLEEENLNLRKLPGIIDELNSQNHVLMRENAVLKKEKEYTQSLLRNESNLLDEVSRQYEQFVRINKAKEEQDRRRFQDQVEKLSFKINDLQLQLSGEIQKNNKIEKQLEEKQKQLNQNAELILKLQRLTQEKLFIIQKHTQQEKKLKQSLEDKTWQGKQKKRQIIDLEQIMKNNKQEYENMVRTNKALIQEKEKHIKSLTQQNQQQRSQRCELQQRLKNTTKNLQEKIRLHLKEIQLLKQKIYQLQAAQKDHLDKYQTIQQTLQAKQETIRNLGNESLNQQATNNVQKQSINSLQRENRQLREKQSQTKRTMIQGQAIIESKMIQIQDLRTELQLIKKTRERQQRERAQNNYKNTYEHYEQQKEIQEKYKKAEDILKAIFKEFSAYKNQISQVKNYNLTVLQKLVSTFNSTQRYNLSRQIEKISQLISKLAVISPKVERAVEMIKKFLPLRQINRNSIIVKEGSIFKVNRHYPS